MSVVIPKNFAELTLKYSSVILKSIIQKGFFITKLFKNGFEQFPIEEEKVSIIIILKGSLISYQY